MLGLHCGRVLILLGGPAQRPATKNNSALWKNYRIRVKAVGDGCIKTMPLSAD
jgi:hypothetical protein